MLPANALVLYKSRPARVIQVTDKVEIDLGAGNLKRVRPKDVTLLHPGPLHDLGQLTTPCAGEVEDAWELLEGSATKIGELSELVFGEHTPQTAWAAWQLVAEGLYFQGTPEVVSARSANEVAQARREREERAAEERSRQAFLTRARGGHAAPEDQPFLAEIEAMARGSRATSRLLRELDLPQTPEAAHRLLLRMGHWTESVNPYPPRARLELTAPRASLPDLPVEHRHDFTQLQAYAIDDEDNQDPDDALSFDGQRLWVHVADVASAVSADGPVDVQARARAANLYLPEGVVPMLPVAATTRFGLGLQDPSPALSFGITLDDDGEIRDLEVVRSWVRVQRLSYEQAEYRLAEQPLATFYRLASRFRARRQAAGAVHIALPEVCVRVRDGEAVVKAIPELHSRAMVTDCMLMAGMAAAGFALQHEIPFPFAKQALPTAVGPPRTPAAMFAFRRRLQRTQLGTAPGVHGGLGLAVYSRVTSPLRRYLDLVAHQQLRAFLNGTPTLSTNQITERIAAVATLTDQLRSTERAANRHWTLVYLLRTPRWQGQGILLEEQDGRGTVLIPALGLETRVRLRAAREPNSAIGLQLSSVDLPALLAHFRVEN